MEFEELDKLEETVARIEVTVTFESEKKPTIYIGNELSQTDYNHLLEIDAALAERKYKISDIINIFIDRLTPEIADSIAARNDMGMDFPIEI